jgi:hypothetical protein
MKNLDIKIKLYANKEVDFLKDAYFKMMAKVLTSKNGILILLNLQIAQLDAFEAEATTYENNQKIIATRKSLYGAWEKQLEEIYDNGMDSWKARIAQIKADNPKENN